MTLEETPEKEKRRGFGSDSPERKRAGTDVCREACCDRGGRGAGWGLWQFLRNLLSPEAVGLQLLGPGPPALAVR